MAINDCQCNKNTHYESEQVIRLYRETKGRKGKGVTLVKGMGGTEKEIKDFAKKLKQTCNCGGSVKSGVIEIQGDHREKIKQYLSDKGFEVKLSGR
jgi:translation initiation factor 1